MSSFTLLKILYGLFELPLAAIDVFLRLYLFIHFTEVVGLPPWMSAVALLLSLVADSAFAPWIGVKSDAWFFYGRGRWPWALTGALIAGVSFIGLFQIPSGTDPGLAFAGLILLLLSLNAGLTLVNVSYHALLGDLQDQESWTTYLGWRSAFAILGYLIGLAVPGFFIALQDPVAFRQSAWILTILLFFLGVFASFSRPAFRPTRRQTINPDHAALTAGDFFRRRAMPPMPPGTPSWLFAVAILNVAVTFAASLALPYYKVTLRLDEALTQNILLAGIAGAIVSIPLWLGLARKTLPRSLFVVSALPWAAFTAVLPLILNLSGSPIVLLLLSGVIGGSFMGSVILWERGWIDRALREGTGLGAAYGLWRMTSRISKAFGTAAAGIALSWAGIQGFDPRIDDRLALMYGPGIGILILLALWIAMGSLKKARL